MGDYRCFSLSNYFIICLLRLIFFKSWRRNIWSNVEQWQWHPPRDLSPLRQTELEEKATVRGSAGTWPRVSSCPSWAAAHMTAERGVQSQLWLSRPSPSPEKVTSLKFSCKHLNRADAQSWARQHQRQGGGGDDSDKACEPTSEKSQPKISKRRRGSTMTVFSGQCLQSQWNKKGLKLPNDSKGHFWVQLA